MLKGLAITPPVLGRISIGKVVEKNGKRLPEKDDQFTITSQVQGKDGWLLHPLNDELRQGKDDKLRSIPVRLLFNEPEMNFRADYTLFDRQNGRPMCVGNGETCKRIGKDGVQSLPCPSPDACPLAKGGACKPYGRLNVVIGDEDPLGSFVFRTTGFNSTGLDFGRHCWLTIAITPDMTPPELHLLNQQQDFIQHIETANPGMRYVTHAMLSPHSWPAIEAVESLSPS